MPLPDKTFRAARLKGEDVKSLLCWFGFHEWHPDKPFSGGFWCCRKGCRAAKLFGKVYRRPKVMRLEQGREVDASTFLKLMNWMMRDSSVEGRTKE